MALVVVVVVARPTAPDCAAALGIIDAECARLGIPIAKHKRDGPTTCLTFLGIEIDTIAAQLRLPADKLGRIQSLLAKWGDRKACSRKGLESLVGLLNHACKVVRAGRSFLRRMLDLLHTVPTHPLRPHPIRLNRGFRSDLAAGIGRLGHMGLWCVARLPLVSGTVGPACGGPADNGEGAVPHCAGLRSLGPQWHHHRVRCLCDNQAVVAAMYSRTCRDSHCMHLLSALAFVEAQHAFHLQPEYIDTGANHLADDLSRDHLSSFLAKVPWADRQPTPLPPPLLTLLLDPMQDWTSPLWLRQFRDTIRVGWPHQQGGPMPPH